MSAEFVDTNILVYAHDVGAGTKHDKSVELLTRLFEDGSGALSVQVLSDFYVAATQKLAMKTEEVEAAIRDLAGWIIHRLGHADVLRASRLHRRYGVAWRDAMILNSAIETGSSVVWSEDLSDGQTYEGVTVRNPFA